MNDLLKQRVFLDANQEPVEYDGSQISWRVSVYAIIQEENRVLIIKHNKEKLYDVIGGGIEFGEDIEETLHREALEEAGARIVVGKLLHSNVSWFYHWNHGSFYQTLRLFYSAKLIGKLDKPLEKEIDSVEFVPVAEIGTKYKLPYIVEEVIKENLV